jgi:protein disulfide-isomerase
MTDHRRPPAAEDRFAAPGGQQDRYAPQSDSSPSTSEFYGYGHNGSRGGVPRPGIPSDRVADTRGGLSNPPNHAPVGQPPASHGTDATSHQGQRPSSAAGGNPPLGLDGYCPVTLITKRAWKKGDVRYGAIHRGRTYLFAGPAEQKLFLDRPDDLSPVLSGNDAVEFVDNDRLVPGERQHGLEYGNRMYLFASEATLQKFSRSPRNYAISVHQTMGQALR